MKFVHRLMSYRLAFTLSLMLTISMVHGQSVLQNGEWIKVGVTETGIYKLDRSFLNNAGLPVGSLDPRTIKIYGNGGGGMLPQSNAEPRALDLSENAIHASGQSDGSLDNGDYFLFYARSSDKVEWSETGVDYENNLYSDTTYYFITYGGDNGLRVSQQASVTEQPSRITEFNDAIIFEADDETILREGRKWYGESLSPATGLNADFSFSLQHVSELESIEFAAMARSQENSSMTVSINNDLVGTLNIDAIPSGPGTTYSIKGEEASDVYSLSGASDDVNVGVTFNPSGSGVSIGHIDWFVIRAKRELMLDQGSVHFRSLESLDNAISTYSVAGASSSTRIWDVTNPTVPERIGFSLESGSAIFSATSLIVKEFVAFEGSNFPTPIDFGQVANQSIKSTVSVDGLIVTHPNFISEAKRLAQFHSSNSGLQVAVATTREIYNEFSSGMQDVTAIRDYAKYVYDEGGRLKYLLLFGDCSYDYKDRIDGNANLVPVYQARQSLHPIFSYSSDDYFGFFEEDEGEWEENSDGDHTMEIGVGRLPVNDLEQAKTVVDKVIRYSTSTATLGKWRNEIVYVVDDGDFNVHMDHGEGLSTIVENNSGYNTSKLYLDAFDQEINPSNERSPLFTRAIKQAVKQGAFFIDFIGHGNERLWMDEQVLTESDIEGFTNYNRLPIFVTATCQFGRYDNPGDVSGAEMLCLGEQGAIALLTTTRPVFANTNYVLNEAFHEAVLDLGLDGDLRLGDILRETKNNGLQGPVNRNFALLGDPMLRPAYPKYEIVLDGFDEEVDFSALERVSISGSIQHEGAIVDDFNGRVLVDLFDVPTEKITKGQESNQYTFYEQDNSLFRGQSTVTNGEFSFEFIVPKNISYSNQAGKFSLYAFSESQVIDAVGASRNVILVGTNDDAELDQTSPSLSVYLNEPSFRNGSKVGSGALLIAKFSDDSGMNISNSGFDRGITMDLNGEIIELNEYYTADLDDFTKGTVLYPFQDLEPGRYVAKIKGSDVHNNPVSKTVEFVVTNQPILQTYNFKTYPNPARTFTRFYFDHDREGESLDVEIALYSMRGEKVGSKVEEVKFSSRSVEIEMELDENSLKDGLYIYRVLIRSQLDGASRELSGRMVIRN